MSEKEQLFRLHTLREKAEVHQFQCCVTWKNRLYIGTTDGGIMVYSIQRKDGQEWGAHGIRIIKTGNGKPIQQMVVVADIGVLLVLCGGNLQQHKLDEAQEFQDHLIIGSHVTQITVKKEKGKFCIAALQRKKVMLFDWKDSRTFGLSRELTIVEGCTSVSWCGKSLLMAIKQEFVLLDVKNHALDALFETDSAHCPVCNMSPTKELLVAQEGAGVRVTHEGLPVQPGLSWVSLPTQMGYHHPYLMSVHDGNSIDIHCPSLDADAEVGIPASQSLTLKYVSQLSTNNYVNFDLANPAKNPSGYESNKEEIRRDFLVAITTVNSAFLVEMLSIAEQAKSACMAKNFDHALKLCDMCPGEVSRLEQQEIRLRYGLDFFSAKKYGKAVDQFRLGKADARFVASLLPGFLPSHVDRTFKFPFGRATKPDVRELTNAQRNEALQAIVSYLIPMRRPPRGKDQEKTQRNEDAGPSNDSFDLAVQLGTKKPKKDTDIIDEGPLSEDEVLIQETIDTALLRAYSELGRDMDVLMFLQKPNHCTRADTELLLTSRQEYVALCTMWLSHGDYEKVLKFCRLLGFHGVPDDSRPMINTLSATPLADFLTYALPKSEYPRSGFSTQRALERKIREYCKQQKKDAETAEPGSDAALAGGEISAKKETTMTYQLVGIMMAIHTLKNLPADAPKGRLLLAEHCTWILANVDPIFSLEIYNGAAIKSEPREILKVLKSSEIQKGMVNGAELQAKYLENVLGAEGGFRNDDSDLHNQRIQALIQMLDSPQKRDAAHKSLRLVLEKSEAYEPMLVLTWLTLKHKALLATECAIVYRRVKCHSDAINMYVNETHDLEAAKRYAEEVSRDEEEDAFELLLQALLKPKREQGARIREGSRLKEALDVVNKCPGVDARSALPLLPDETPLISIRDFLKKAVRETSAKRRNKEIYHNVLKTLSLQSEVENSKLKRRHIVVESSTLCKRCNRKIADAVFARYPNGVLVHQACLEKEHICPVSDKDFRKSAMLESYHADARSIRFE